ncbi:hypothetical protein KS670_003361 [Vibrio parahaemolyticus]|uniref:hypothetical protein n=1 Tax=Vibrio sp. B183 TaxID=1526762 RepID=UPI000501DEC7|nr:hypothetical protein [Vibrio sp. B183]EHR0227801.1 hypothetical protein [Vibrio parahaemolyticus]KFI12679.1 hypothetical protein IX95_06920 [Vibrio sp. B183]
MKGKILFITTIFGFSFGAETTGYNLLVANAYSMVTWLAVLLGLICMFLGLKKLKDYGDNQNQKKVGFTPLILLFIGSALMSYSQMISTISVSFLGEESGFCFGLEDAVDSATEYSSNCWDGSGADLISPELKEKLDSEEQKAVGKWIDSAVMTLQFLGVVWFISTMMYIKRNEEAGNDSDKPNYFYVAGSLLGCCALTNAVPVYEILIATFDSLTM